MDATDKLVAVLVRGRAEANPTVSTLTKGAVAIMQTPTPAVFVPPALERAAALQQARQDAFVVLPDISRKTGLGIADLIRIESGQTEVSPQAYARISTAIEELVDEREHRYSRAAGL